MNQKDLLKQISEISFMTNNLALYLDTHPTDEQALTAFYQFMEQRKQLLKTYAEQFQPLTLNCVQDRTNNGEQKHFTWCDGPLPWEGGVQ